jgi:hypothetical protein
MKNRTSFIFLAAVPSSCFLSSRENVKSCLILCYFFRFYVSVLFNRFVSPCMICIVASQMQTKATNKILFCIAQGMMNIDRNESTVSCTASNVRMNQDGGITSRKSRWNNSTQRTFGTECIPGPESSNATKVNVECWSALIASADTLLGCQRYRSRNRSSVDARENSYHLADTLLGRQR